MSKRLASTTWEHITPDWTGHQVWTRWETPDGDNPELFLSHRHAYQGTIINRAGTLVVRGPYDLDIMPPPFANLVELQP